MQMEPVQPHFRARGIFYAGYQTLPDITFKRRPTHIQDSADTPHDHEHEHNAHSPAQSGGDPREYLHGCAASLPVVFTSGINQRISPLAFNSVIHSSSILFIRCSVRMLMIFSLTSATGGAITFLACSCGTSSWL